MSTERKHHPFSPSTLQAREACAKFEPTQTESEASLDGTRQHAATEKREDDNALSDFQAIAVAECLAYADSITAKYPGGTILKEEYFSVDNEVWILRVDEKTTHQFFGTTGGYPDFVVISKDESAAEIIDWKFGKQPVETTENNLQGIAYLLGVLRRFPKIQTCTVHFVLPHRDELDIHTFSLTPEIANRLLLRVKTVVARAKQAQVNPDDFSMAKPTSSACLFCALIGKCPKVAELVLNVGKKYAPAEIPETITPSLIQDPKQVSFGIKLAQIVKTWAEAYRAQATHKAITDPDFIPSGYILVSMERRKVVNAKLLAEVAKGFVTPERATELDNLFDIPITKVEKLIELCAPRGQKKKTVEAFGEALVEKKAVEPGKPYAILRMSGEDSD